MPSYTLHAPAGNFRAFSALIAAEYNGIDVVVNTDNLAKAAAASPTGKTPVLEIKSNTTDVVFSSHAIARYLGGLRRDTNLLGTSLTSCAMVDAWMDFSATQLELPACVWYYPVRLCGV